MSERGQKIFKILVWMALAAVLVLNLIQLKNNTEKKQEQKYVYQTVDFMPESWGAKYSLRANVDNVLAGETTEVQFVIPANTWKKIKLYCNHMYVGDFVPGDINENAKGTDGLYYFTYTITPKVGEKYIFYAKLGADASNVIEINTVSEIPTNESIKEVQKVIDTVMSVERSYKGKKYISDSKVSEYRDALREAVDRCVADNNIKVLEITGYNTIDIIFGSGIHYRYDIPRKGYADETSDVSLSVRNVGAFLESNSNEGAEALIEDKTYVNEEVSLDNIKSAFQPNSFITWYGPCVEWDYGRGGYYITGVKLSEAMQEDDRRDLLDGSVIVKNNGKLAVDYGFFAKHVDDLSNSFVFFGGADDDYLNLVLIQKNADVAVRYAGGNKSSANVMKTLTEGLCTIDPATGKHKTIGEALYACEAKYPNGVSSYKLKYVGNPQYRIDDMFEKNNR